MFGTCSYKILFGVIWKRKKYSRKYERMRQESYKISKTDRSFEFDVTWQLLRKLIYVRRLHVKMMVITRDKLSSKALFGVSRSV